ncbi:MAG: hypothetical protein H7067_04380 [Burkholderiales bacterium]|nr:hypothetical protein [Opitutaceae bacterium]
MEVAAPYPDLNQKLTRGLSSLIEFSFIAPNAVLAHIPNSLSTAQVYQNGLFKTVGTGLYHAFTSTTDTACPASTTGNNTNYLIDLRGLLD